MRQITTDTAVRDTNQAATAAERLAELAELAARWRELYGVDVARRMARAGAPSMALDPDAAAAVVEAVYGEGEPAPAAPAAPALPELPITVDGMGEAIRLAGWEVSWNLTGNRPECRQGGGEWVEASGRALDRMMTAASERAQHRGGPWRVRSPAHERRLLTVLASRHERQGEGSEVYELVGGWARGRRGVSYANLGEVLRQAGALNRYESKGRAPRAVYADARRALEDLGWRYATVRQGGGEDGRKRWVVPPRD